MKNPLHYQISEFDCGPTSMQNAISFLFERDQIPAEILRNIMLYSLDCYSYDGHPGERGTSTAAMTFLSHWLNSMGEIGKLPVSTRYLSGRDVYIGRDSYINDALKRGGAVVVRLFLDEWHYVLLTGEQDEDILVFDPYYWEDPLPGGIPIIMDHPTEYNRIVPWKNFNREELELYALGPRDGREAVIVFNEKTKITEEKSIEYFI